MPMIIDSHQHFWALQRGDYDWLTECPDDSLTTIQRDFQPADLQPLLRQQDVHKTVVVQAAPTVAETEYLLQLAESTDFIAGVVGWVDMEANDAIAVLKRLATSPYLKSIRPMVQDIADPNWLLRPALDPVFRYLVDHQLCFDALIKPLHIPLIGTLAKRYPDLQIVIDHGAKPAIVEGQFSDWADAIKAVSAQPNVYCKLSGLLTEAPAAAQYEDIARYMQQLLDCFGSKRLMWGSDWPVLTLANSYEHWLGMVKESIAALSEAQQQDILGNTAKRFYRLTQDLNHDD